MSYAVATPPDSDRRLSEVDDEGPSMFRQFVDGIVCLAVAVVLFRTFEVEGYIISTGSMAPHLLGYHKRVTCPDCHYLFAYGISKSGQNAGSKIAAAIPGEGTPDIWSKPFFDEGGAATCPNCGLSNIPLDATPPNQGDQLLVFKNAYQLRPPQRWEVVVFQNPNKPTQAYVKRVVGLPGEQVQIIDGDVYINGEISRKSYEEIQSLSVLVYDHDHRPHEEGAWNSRLVNQENWKQAGNGFEFEHVGKSDDNESLNWVSYRHWVRQGGNHTTSVPLETWPDEVPNPRARMLPVRYDAGDQKLSCRGVISPRILEALNELTSDETLRSAFRELAEKSHESPVTDRYGYNSSSDRVPIHDVMVSADVHLKAPTGEFVIFVSDGRNAGVCVFNLDEKVVKLLIDGGAEAVAEKPIPSEWLGQALPVEVALVDRQVVVAVNHAPLFEPYLLGEAVAEEVLPRPIHFAARDTKVRVDSLKVHRDVYYTKRWNRNAVNEPYQLGEGEFFMLGDNSPVSVDGRDWSQAAVPRKMLLGKPFLVHLPSRPGQFRLGDYVGHVRLPDVSRIRYIR